MFIKPSRHSRYLAQRLLPYLILCVLLLTAFRAGADCSFEHNLACVWSESTCWPALADSREAFGECVNKASKGYCDACIGYADPRDDTGVPTGIGDEGGSAEPFSFVRNTLAARAVAPNLDGRLEVATVDRNGVLFHIWQANGGWSQPAVFPGSPQAAGPATIVQRGIGPLDVFDVAPNGTVGHVRQLAPNVNWGNWTSLGGVMQGSVAATLQTLGTTILVAIGRDSRIYYARDPNLQSWISLGGTGRGSPAVTVNRDGRLEIFAADQAGVLRHIWELSPGGAWSQWAVLGNGVQGDPVAIGNSDGRIAVFVTTATGGLRMYEQAEPNSGWAAPFAFPGVHSGRPAVILDEDKKLEVFVVGVNDRAVYSATQSKPGAAFGSWTSLGGTVLSSPEVSRASDKTLQLFGVGLDHSIWVDQKDKSGGKKWSGWQRLSGQVNEAEF